MKLFLFSSSKLDSVTVPGVTTLITSLLTIPFASFGSSNCSQIATLCPFYTESQIKFACEQIQNWAKQENPPYIWIMLGTNDLLDNQNFTAEDVTDRMRNFLTEIMKQPAVINKQIHLGLISPASMEYGAWVDSDRLYEESRRLHTEYRHLSEKLNLLFISTENWNIPVIFDGVHFSEEGHRIFAAQIKTELSRIEKA